MSARDSLLAEPWRHDFFAVMRRLERSHPERPRIGDSAALAEDFVRLSQDPFLDFPASTLDSASRDANGRYRLGVRFLGLFGPQGALPLTTTEETYGWLLARDDAFPRFADVFQHRFLQLFFRAWADARPIAQHDRPEADRFVGYIGATIGVASPGTRDADSVPDLAKLEFAGLIAPQVKSASRLKRLISGLFDVPCEIDEFVGSWLVLDPADRSRLGQRQCGLGVDTLLGGSVFSVEDKIRIRIFTRDLDDYERFLPTGPVAEQIADAVYLFLGDELDWDVELAIPAGKVAPVRLGQAGRLGWTSWMAPNWAETDREMRTDTRFHLAERLAARRRAPEGEDN